MSAPLFFTGQGRLSTVAVDDRFVLDGPEGRHAADVSRLGPGETVLLADGSGLLARSEVVERRKGELELRVQEVVSVAEPDPRFTLVQALAKGDRDLLAIEVGTELGVDDVVPWQADRSIVRWRGERAAKAHRKWEQTVLAATKQARRARVPGVAPLADRQAVIQRIAAADLALVLHEEATEPLAGVDLPGAGEVLLVVGPEGGISPEETQAFVDAGARTVRLGSTVLRTSTAGSAAIALLSARARWR
ncbi:16S rRNA (uracil(1498)-N(3))-methyltransferase [Ornithinicoccus hortensis]|uniref:Ribosomal RNA small subunit methyltransferase E n=1 Tax=Ornithinicoccus hortensis TaxID=82346 RepID=A0A542YRZ8_9MICO|nr:16S rRNA (uracil(1498)-N(3))-methyltransferase [Ornithinicoccus hortensis]TQL50872.1 16S rRNA (uracil1498-N3)-methyltransferase [Ornithinicoccus hortensis]